jgi:hypothetical protein
MMQVAENFIVTGQSAEWGGLFYSLRLRGHSTQVELFVLPLCVEIAVRFPEQRRAPRSTPYQKFLSIKKLTLFQHSSMSTLLPPRCLRVAISRLAAQTSPPFALQRRQFSITPLNLKKWVKKAFKKKFKVNSFGEDRFKTPPKRVYPELPALIPELKARGLVSQHTEYSPQIPEPWFDEGQSLRYKEFLQMVFSARFLCHRSVFNESPPRPFNDPNAVNTHVPSRPQNIYPCSPHPQKHGLTQ